MSSQQLQDSFEKAVEEAKVLPERPSNNDLSELYGLYKQATVGDIQNGESKGGIRRVEPR